MLKKMKNIKLLGNEFAVEGNKVIHNHPFTIYCPKTGEYWEANVECTDGLDVINTRTINKKNLEKLGFSGDSEWMAKITTGYTLKYDMRGRVLYIHKKTGTTLKFYRINQMFELNGV